LPPPKSSAWRCAARAQAARCDLSHAQCTVEAQPMKVIFESDLVIDQALAAVRKMG
jgi:hypothetical protein